MARLALISRASYALPTVKNLSARGWSSVRTTPNPSLPSTTVINCITCNLMWFDINKISWWDIDQKYIHSIYHWCRKAMQGNFFWVLNIVLAYLCGQIWPTEVIWFLQILTDIFKRIEGFEIIGVLESFGVEPFLIIEPWSATNDLMGFSLGIALNCTQSITR